MSVVNSGIKNVDIGAISTLGSGPTVGGVGAYGRVRAETGQMPDVSGGNGTGIVGNTLVRCNIISLVRYVSSYIIKKAELQLTVP